MKFMFIVVLAALSASLTGCGGGEKYRIVGAGNSCAYKMDIETGQVWFISPDGERKLPFPK